MDPIAISAYAITAISIIILAIVLLFIILWKWTRKLVYELTTKKARLIFSATHIIPLIIFIACFAAFQPWKAYYGEIKLKEHAEMKREIGTLNKTANTAFNALSALNDDVIPVAVLDDTLDGTKIRAAVDKEMHVDLPKLVTLKNFISIENDLNALKKTCDALKKVDDTSFAATRIRDDLEILNKGNFYGDDLDIALSSEKANHKDNLNNNISQLKDYLREIKETLIKSWKNALIQFDNSIDARKHKLVEHLDSIVMTILVTDISLLYVPSGFALLFIIFSIATIWTKDETSPNRILFIINRVVFYSVALILVVCSVYPFFEYSPECPIGEDKTVYFNFPIPTRNGAKNSHDILSTCSGNLFDSPNDDILLLGEFGFFQTLKKFLVEKMRQLKEKDETNRKTTTKVIDMGNNWKHKRDYVDKLRKMEENCTSSNNMIENYIKEFDSEDGKMVEFVGILKQREVNWNNLETKVGSVVDEHVKVVSGMVATQITKINDGIKILSVDCQTTRTLFSKVNNMKCSKNNNIGFIPLTRALVVFALGLCSIHFLFTYRSFGPLPRDDRVKWIEKVSEMTFEQIKNLFRLYIPTIKRQKEVVPLKPVRRKVAFGYECMKDTRVVLKNPKNDFIHANRVTMPDESIFIATNAPIIKSKETDDTTEDFWEMVWQEKVNTIAMLNQVFEKNQQSCTQYFPEKKDNVLKFGDFGIKLIEIKQSDKIPWKTILRCLELTNKKFPGEKRVINHINFIGWPDHGVPDDAKSVIDLVNFVCETNQNKAPIVVHCAAGIGRTGVFLTYAYARQYLETFCDLNLLLVIQNVREMRDGAIQNSLQYAFVFVCLIKSFQMDGLVKQSKIQRFLDDWKVYKSKDENQVDPDARIVLQQIKKIEKGEIGLEKKKKKPKK